MSDALPAFREFLTIAGTLRSASCDRVTRFQTFLAQALPHLVRPARRHWDTLALELEDLRPWIVTHDLLASIVHLEDSYTELIAWALSPVSHPASAELRQRMWLESLGLNCSDGRAVEPRTQFWTGDGIPDLILPFDSQTVVVEVKKWSLEHQTPSGGSQTLSYPHAVRAKLQAGKEHQVHMVFLTPDCRAAESPDAICTSFAHLAVVLARAVSGFELEGDLRFAFATLITHLATFDLPLVREALDWHKPPDEHVLLSNFEAIRSMAALLSGKNHV